jgi:hypothetical protein
VFFNVPCTFTNTPFIGESVQASVFDESAHAGTSVTGKQLVHNIRAGSASYELIRPVQVNFTWVGNMWMCWSDDFGFAYVGTGESLPSAYSNWENLVHVDFQTLYHRRPFEMAPEEQKRWNLLVGTIDVLHYRQNTPLSLREVGCISWDKYQYPTRINWINGSSDYFSLSQVPPELAECKPGQWIEAVVKRHPVTNRLLTIEHIQKIKSLFMPSPSQLNRDWESVPRADLPKTKWDWPK